MSDISPAVKIISNASLSIMFALTGLVCFGNNPQKLRKILVIFLLINVPFLILQITGASSFFMYWGTDYLHTPSVLNIKEVGTFKDIPVYPTLLVSIQEINNQIGQARPAGLMAANNWLSVIVAFTLFFNMHLRSRSVLNIGDVVVNLTAVLVMSKLVFLVVIVTYLFGLLSRNRIIKLAAVKNIFVFLMFVLIYYLSFPGLFDANLNSYAFAGSIGIRLVDLFLAAELDTLVHLFWFSSDEYALTLDRSKFSEDHSFSGFAFILSSGFAVPIFLLITVLLLRFRKIVLLTSVTNSYSTQFYNLFVLIIFFNLLAVPFLFKSILACFIIGIIMQPFVSYRIKRKSLHLKFLPEPKGTKS
ncbi:hypothetical protein OAJ10_02490 [Paracoccaceae bacterium]|nr:hypothetical protein [Paracoccaceae bacterium]